jgi:hypothetical protein
LTTLNSSWIGITPNASFGGSTGAKTLLDIPALIDRRID